MISNKKSHAMKMLQLALALSLLHYNPDYLLHRWDSQLELSSHGDGWELEMLRTVHRVDMDQNPYGNRKGLSPRIEDFLNFDVPSLGGVGSGVGEYKLPTRFNGSTFVMNLHNTTGNSSVQTAALQDVQSSGAGGTPSSVVVGGASAPTSGGASSGSSLGEINIDTSSLAAGNANHSLLHPAPELDIFLSPHLLHDQRSIWEQNLADLQDYNDLPLQASPYANLPLKDGQQQPPNSSHLDLSLAALIHGFTAGGGNASPLSTAALNDSTPHPTNLGSVTVEHLGANNSAGRNEDDVEENMYLGRLFGQEEADEDEGEMAGGAANACEVEGLTTDEPFGSATFANEVIIGDDVEEESEIAEVLYKQDVDLGFSLDQEKIINASYASGNSGASSDKSKPGDGAKPSKPSMSDSAIKDTNADAEKDAGDASVDDIEKLKALEELQQDKDKDNENPLEDITNEWNGIPFTIDNETGEYIRLPLDELLNDVLKLSEFPLEDELSNDPVASTSQAAAALNENQAQRIVSETGEDFLIGEGVPSKQRRVDAEDKDNDQDKADGDSFSVCDFEDLQNSVGSPLFDLDEDAKKELDEMLQSTAPPYHHPHPHHGHPHAHPHPHSHHHATMHHAHAHHAAAAAAAHQRAVQQANYGGGVGVGVGVGVGSGTASAFQRQPAAGGFHHGHHQGRMPRLNRSVSMERLQDFATYFSPIPSMVGGVSEMSPYPHHYPGYSYQASPSNGNPSAPGQHAAQYGGGAAAAPLQPPPPPPPHHAAMLHHPNAALGDICPTGQPHYGHNLGSAVTSSMHLTNSSHEADGAAAAAAAAYKVEHDMMYYGNTSSDMNQADGFMNSIFTDEDLHLMDMNESFCRMVDNSTSNNSSVLGLPSSGHVSNGSGSSAQLAAGNPHGNQANGAVGGVGPMSGSAVGTGPAGMTADLLTSGGAGAQGGADRLDASSDSAVSSMGSERVPSLSDGEWGEGSDSAQDYHQGKYGGPYDFSYNNNSRLTAATRQPPVAQKKHQLYGKRDPHKQTPSVLPPTAPPAAATAVQSQSIKYEYDAGYASSGMASGGGISEPGAMGPALTKDYNHHQAYGMGASGSGFSGDYTVRPSPRTSQDLVQLNHTYSLPQGSGSLPRPQARDKKPMVATKTATKGTSAGGSSSSSSAGGSSSSSSTLEDEHLTRDEKRARSLNIPIAVQDIINLPMDEFNERLSKYDLSENQLSLIRDIRRRGKNKVAAQNCRKRKLDQILTLEDEVNAVVKRKTQLNADRDHLEGERKRISNKFALLHRHVFQYLRDPEGNPCSPSDYSLQQAADGSVYLLPRDKTEGNSTATAASNAVSSASAGSLNGHVPAQTPMHGLHSQHGMQAQHVVGGGLPQQQQQQPRLPPHLQQQQQQHHLQSQQPGGPQQQQQHRKE